jgi:transcriptional regulator with XRE-family HTH domain/tetratricopeptide (TPR) repeat protein
MDDPRPLAARLRKAREDAGVSLAGLAARTHYSKPLLGMLETGKRTIKPEHVVAYSRALNVAIGTLYGQERRAPENSATSPSDVTDSVPPSIQDSIASPGLPHEFVTLLTTANLAALVAITSGAVSPGNEADERSTDLGRLVEMMKRRGLLQLATKLAAGGALTSSALGGGNSWAATTLDPDEQERVAQAIASPGRVDEKVLEHIEAVFVHCKLQEDALGSRAVLDTALAQQNLVHHFLGHCPDHLQSRLLSLYSNMSTSIGYYFFELNDIDRAWYHLEQARKRAHEAQNTELGISALCAMSYQASWHGKAHTGLDLSAAAESLAKKTGNPLPSAFAAQRAATAYALDGQYDACMAELDKAHDGLVVSAGQVPPESPLYFYNEGYLISHKSECLLRLGKPQAAIAAATDGLAMYDKSFVDGYTFCTLQLGNAHLQSGEIDEAARVIGSAAAFATSPRHLGEIRKARVEMQPWHDTIAVKELDEQMTGLGGPQVHS